MGKPEVSFLAAPSSVEYQIHIWTNLRMQDCQYNINTSLFQYWLWQLRGKKKKHNSVQNKASSGHGCELYLNNRKCHRHSELLLVFAPVHLHAGQLLLRCWGSLALLVSESDFSKLLHAVHPQCLYDGFLDGSLFRFLVCELIFLCLARLTVTALWLLSPSHWSWSSVPLQSVMLCQRTFGSDLDYWLATTTSRTLIGWLPKQSQWPELNPMF